LLHASYAFVIEGDAGSATARILAATSAAPDGACRGDWLPVGGGRDVTAAQLWDDPAAAGPDCELVAAPFRTDLAIVLGRIGGPPFRPAELTRLVHLGRVAQALLAEPDGR
jgi:hypothetical protein